MTEQKSLVNRVEESGLITLDLADFFSDESVEEFDLKNFLVKELVLMEKHFREELKKVDWSKYSDKVVALYCSNDAIIPMWAYMLATSYLEPYAKEICFGNRTHVEEELLKRNIKSINAAEYSGTRVVIKGCGDKAVPEEAFMLITKKLQPVVQSLMYGEPCSTVPVYKKPKSP